MGLLDDRETSFSLLASMERAISLCETSLSDDSPVPDNALPGYKYHAHTSGEKKSGVGIFYKEDFPLRIREDLSFEECLVTELIFGRKKIFFTVFYRNPEHNANSPEFEQFLLKFENWFLMYLLVAAPQLLWS